MAYCYVARVATSRRANLLQRLLSYLSRLGDLAGYSDPKSDCSLLKCALVYFGLVSPEMIAESPDEYLSTCLEKFCGHKNAGLEIVTTSLLPHGSGMGTSSILGGCIIASLSTCVGIDMSDGKSHPNGSHVGAKLMYRWWVARPNRWTDWWCQALHVEANLTDLKLISSI